MKTIEQPGFDFEPTVKYSISESEFKSPPTELNTYHPGDEINRENFNSFFIRSFAISRGELSVQLLFMKWLEIQQGFDFIQTLENFEAAGAWESMSDEEQKEFKNQFNKIPAHSDEFTYILKEEEMINGIDQVLHEAKMDKNRTTSLDKYDGTLKEIKNFDGFSEFLRSYLSSPENAEEIIDA